MESSPGPARSARAPPTPTCTVPGLLVGLTKLFNLTKVCAAPSPAADDSNGEAAAATKCGPDPDPGPDPRLVLMRLFDAVSALKSGYVKLQRAHFPYDQDKVAAADEAVASELDSVAALQCLCTSRRGIGPLVDDRWAQVQRLEAEARRRDAHIAALARELRRLQRDNARLSRQVVRSRNDDRRRAGMLSVPKELATPAALVRQFVAASRSVGNFAELLLGGACSLTAAASSTESSDSSGTDAAGAEQARWWRRYSLEAHLWRAMLLVGGAGAGDEECCSGGGDAGSSFRRIMKPRDALDALMQFPRSGLSAFCRAAYIAAVPAEAEAAACGNLDHRAFVSRGGHPRTPVYRAFAAAARSVWALRVLMTAVARCSEPESGQGGGGGVRMFYAGRGSMYAAEFMESVAVVLGAEEEARRVEAGDREEKLSVALTVTPGVKVGDTVVRCRVLLCRRREGFVGIR
ncbi:uncharacterized protein LOC8074866 [Sorghum bicolor]|jgi:hypothetical protein|uniref:Uncharacterized protein n=1 Tax=Sorghum bicolor TaxID=4558 RepID=C5YRL9_SORBI|nr:uncharacterized protein LOC8074866 [Sorghum bicolor]EES16619.1 hypothetical protein SORBI_3008G031600 [Sorghum bicolor]OQU78686.1 hypothetical protein SORBI_3008G031600 [Sorghum bicolor]|eukprot:XP_002442781.1 uncharacterized protein LOC8074866 [Sorghum bicolor]